MTLPAPLRRLAAVPIVEQLLRRIGAGRAERAGAVRPPDAIVTSTGRGESVRTTLPTTGTPSFSRLARSASRRSLLTVRAVDDRSAGALRELARRGVPTRVESPERPESIDPDLWSILTETPGADDPDLNRYVRSVRLARAAAPTPSTETVSVLLATRRPALLEQAVRSIRAQREVRLQLVVGLHGSWPDDSERRIARAWPGEHVIVRAEESVSLGALLRRMTERSDGRLVTKWDDDDWYGAHHVADLVRAHAASNARLVGKAAEFVWLETLGETVRRPALGARTFSTNLAGGTLMLTREDLDAAGGFPDAPRSVDRLLIDAIGAQGGPVYRTHGLEFVLRRSATGTHTWEASPQYFLDDAIARRSGLDLGFADIESEGGSP